MQSKWYLRKKSLYCVSNNVVKEDLEEVMCNIKELVHEVAVHIYIANGHILKAKKKEGLHVKCPGKKTTVEALIVAGIIITFFLQQHYFKRSWDNRREKWDNYIWIEF